MFSSGMTETKKDRIQIEGVPLKYFMFLLEFIYTSYCGPLSIMGDCNEEELETVKSILVLANEFMLEVPIWPKLSLHERFFSLHVYRTL